jgi:hypothetical protein
MTKTTGETMSTTNDFVSVDQIRRDRWGRYLVLAPGGDKPTGYTRATTVAKTLDDESNLKTWAQRMTALGLADRPDLVALIAATDPEDKKTLNKICERASEAGGATVRRDLGTALHKMLEDSWFDPNYVAPSPYDADVMAVHTALNAAGFTVAAGMTERMIVNDRHQIAGMFDLLLATEGDAELIMADIKTGSSVDFGALGWATQLAIYANADALYLQGKAADGSDDVREPMPNINKSTGVIIHVQPESGSCDLHWLDLEAGAEALEMAMEVRRIRKFKPLHKMEIAPAETPVEQVARIFDTTPGEIELVSDDWRAWIRRRLEIVIAAGHEQHLVNVWPVGVPTLATGAPMTIAEGEELAAVVSLIEKTHGLPFPDLAPRVEAVASSTLQRSERRPPPPEGELVTDQEVHQLARYLSTMGAEAQAWTLAIVEDASAAGRPIRLTTDLGLQSERRLTIFNALISLSDHASDELARALVSIAIGMEMQPAHNLGDAIGSLTIAEAQRLAQLARAINAGELVAHWADDGTCTITGDIWAATAS